MTANQYNDIARGWLGDEQDSVICFFETQDCTDHTPGRGFVRAEVDLSFLVRGLKAAAFCAEEDKTRASLLSAKHLESLTQASGSAQADISTILPETQVRSFLRYASNSEVVGDWYVYFSKTGFFIEGRSNGETLESSEDISIAELGRWLKGRPLDEPAPKDGEQDEFIWRGGCLLCSFNDVDMFLEGVLDAHPEIAAKEIELKMAERIRASEVVSCVSDVATPKRRRNRLA